MSTHLFSWVKDNGRFLKKIILFDGSQRSWMGKFRRIGLEEQGVAMSKSEGHKHRNKRSSENGNTRFQTTF